MSRTGGGRSESAAVPVPGPCASVQRALAECHRRASLGPLKPEVLCRHLNRSLAECLVTSCCPGETEAVRTLCGSAGTALKRSQCQRARIDLSLCLEAHQEP
uniref:COX assembly mitochondrial protein n=1 Tax=Leersia perrieri TaxID=77586 RepID=A0A0D9X0G4_9ORYZ